MTSADRAGVVDQQHVDTLLGRHVRRRDGAATDWVDGVPLGNGRVGAVVWGDGQPLVATLDHCEFWDRRTQTPPPTPHRFGDFLDALDGVSSPWPSQWPVATPRFDIVTPTRLPPSRLRLTGLGDVTSSTHDLATATLDVVTSEATLRVRVLGEHDVVLIDGCGPVPSVAVDWCSEPSSWELRTRPQPALAAHPTALFDSWEPADRTSTADGESIGQNVPGGGAIGLAWSLAGDTDGWIVAVAMVADRRLDSARIAAGATDALHAALSELDVAVTAHERRWRDFHSRSWLSVPTVSVESLWFAEMSKLGAAVRSDGPPLGLQGPWSPDGRLPPWGGDLHHNVNTQFSYSAMEVTNHPELASSLHRYVERSRPVWSELARDVFGCDGLFVPSATDDDGRCRYEWATVNLALSSGPWLGHVLYTHWRHTGDDEFRVDLLDPFLHGIAEPVLGQLEPGGDGRLHIPRGYSPELVPTGGSPWGPDPSCDLALISWLLDALVELDEIAGRGTSRWTDLADRLAPLPVDIGFGVIGGVLVGRAGGIKVRADAALERSHRHHSHLMAIHPLRRMYADHSDPTVRQIVSSSMQQLMLSGPGEWVGFSAPWAASIASLAGQPDVALGHLRDYAERWVGASTFHVQRSIRGEVPTIWNELGDLLGGDALSLEAGIAFAAAVVDLLMHDHDNVVRVFPSLPRSWPDVAFAGLRAAGGWEIAARSHAHELVAVRVHAHRAGELVLRFPGGTGVIELRRDMRAGDEFVWCENGWTLDDIAPLPVV
ncbi:MAG: glycoside hydrolase family 95-like protein [Actinomycetota bacterium]